MRIKTLTLLALIAMLVPLKVLADSTLSPIEEVNQIVEQQAQYLDSQHGLLMTTTERDAFKIKVIAQKLIKKQQDNPQLTVTDLLNQGIDTYNLTDINEQRVLLIELEAKGSGGGIIPPIGQ